MPYSNSNESEKTRLEQMSIYEQKLFVQGYKNIAGVDEAGRGPLAGPVVAAACILPEGFFLEHINDSKKLTSSIRKKLFHELMDHPDVHVGIGVVDAITIDEVNILQATFQAMKKALENLSVCPEYVLFDGNQKPYIKTPSQAIVKGDAKSIQIAAASIIAKHVRDEMMKKLHDFFPQYGFDGHKGYGTSKHREAIKVFGPCKEHRFSFAPIKGNFLR